MPLRRQLPAVPGLQEATGPVTHGPAIARKDNLNLLSKPCPYNLIVNRVWKKIKIVLSHALVLCYHLKYAIN